MSYRASVSVGVLAFLVAFAATAHPAGRGGIGSSLQRPAARGAASAGGYGHGPAYGGPAYRGGYTRAAGRFAYPGYYAGGRGVPAGAYRGGGRYGGWGPRAYYGSGLPWFLAGAAGYAAYWYSGLPYYYYANSPYAGLPYYYANPPYYAWDPGYGGYIATTPPPVPPAAPPAVAPSPPAQPAPADELVLKGVDFETASAELRPESTAILDGVVDTIRRCNCSGVEIRGYTDSVGDRGYNQTLSEQRANAVKEYLERHGVPAGILTAHGFGEDNPIAANTTVEGRAENRRVTVQFSAPAGTQR